MPWCPMAMPSVHGDGADFARRSVRGGHALLDSAWAWRSQRDVQGAASSSQDATPTSGWAIFLRPDSPTRKVDRSGAARAKVFRIKWRLGTFSTWISLWCPYSSLPHKCGPRFDWTPTKPAPVEQPLRCAGFMAGSGPSVPQGGYSASGAVQACGRKATESEVRVQS